MCLLTILALLLAACQASQPEIDAVASPAVQTTLPAYPFQNPTSSPIPPPFFPSAYPGPGNGLPDETPLPSITPGALPSEPMGYRWLNYLPADNILLAGDIILELNSKSITALDTASGEQRWQFTLPGTKYPFTSFTISGNLTIIAVTRSPIGSTPTVGLISLDLASGNQVWERTLQEIPATSQTFVSSDLLATNSVVLLVSASINLVEAIDPTTGQSLWKQNEACHIPSRDQSGTNSRAPADSFLLACGQSLVNLAASNGAILGEMKLNTSFTGVALIGNSLVTIYPDINSLGFSILGFRWPNSEPLWQQNNPGVFGGWVASDNALAYRAGNLIRQVDIASGKVLWETQVQGITGANLVLAGNKLLAGSNDGIAARLDWTSGTLLWQQDLESRLNPAWNRFIILGEYGQTLLVQVDGFLGKEPTHYSALAALLPGVPASWLTPLPSPTPHPPEAYAPTATLPPLSFLRTPQPTLSPGWTPAPPPVILFRQSGDPAILAYLSLAADLLAYTHGNLDEFIRLVQAWGPLHSFVPGGAVWAQRVDLIGNGQAEVMVSLPMLQEQPATDTPGYTGIICLDVGNCARLVAIFQPQGSIFTPIGLIIVNGSPWLQAPQLLTVDDLDGDGRPEVVLKETTLGMRNTDWLIFGRWDGNSWLPIPINTDLQGNIRLVRFETRPGMPGKVIEVTFDPQAVTWIYGRTHTRVYAWQDGQLFEIQDIPAPYAEPYFLLMDAHSAFMRGDVNQGLQLALNAFQLGLTQHVEVNLIQERVLSFAGIDAMLAYALKSDMPAMQIILDKMNANFKAAPNPYLTAAQRFMDVYTSTYDPKAACEEMAAIVRQNWENASLLMPQVGSTDTIDRADVCPLH